jgi:hypothetical protein
MADVTALREGLAANLESIPRLAESPWLLSNPNPPAVEIQPGEIEYDQAYWRGTDLHRFVASDKGAQKLLDRFMNGSGDYSVKAALESDCTLAGACDDLHVKRCSGPRIFSREGMASVLGAEWDVEVIASGD